MNVVIELTITKVLNIKLACTYIHIHTACDHEVTVSVDFTRFMTIYAPQNLELYTVAGNGNHHRVNICRNQRVQADAQMKALAIDIK